MAGGGLTLEYTPTWVVAGVCLVIVAISLAVERFLHSLGKKLKKKNQKPLFEALQKIKEELMLLGFISLLLTVLQTSIGKICMPKRFGESWLPCTKEHHGDDLHEVEHSQSLFSLGRGRHLAGDGGGGYCESKGMIPLLSLTALHHLHIFIFVLACAHVTFCSLTILLGGVKIQLWKSWEDAIQKQTSELTEGAKITNVQEHAFIKDHFSGHNDSAILCWLHSFFKQFLVSVTRADYITLRLGFIMTHCRGNPKFNFHNYMVRALEHDFKKVVGISWYLWAFVVFFLLLNVSGWNSYFWIMFIPFFLLLAVGTKLEHVISQLAREVAEKHVAIEGDLVVQPSDEHFWFRRPKLVLQLIHIILFQNSFELAYLFWILMQYGFHSCIMGRKRFIFPRLILGFFIQFLCSFSTLPLYAIVTQMGSSFKKEAIFEERVREGLVGWAQKAKKNTGAAAKAAAHK